MYCRNCGKETPPGGEYCMSCGARPLNGTAYCPACAGTTTLISEICVKCGTRLTPPATAAVTQRHSKSKVASILMAVFLGFWTWLYTYKKDAWKFWVSLGVGAVMTIAMVVIMVLVIANNAGDPENFFSTGFIQFMAVYIGLIVVQSGISIWAIVDTIIKNDKWYDNYPLG
jgi:hypothetical protein